MDLDWKPEDVAFREEIRAFFAEHLLLDIKRAGALMTSLYPDHATQIRWQKILHRKGWGRCWGSAAIADEPRSGALQ